MEPTLQDKVALIFLSAVARAKSKEDVDPMMQKFKRQTFKSIVPTLAKLRVVAKNTGDTSFLADYDKAIGNIKGWYAADKDMAKILSDLDKMTAAFGKAWDRVKWSKS